MKGDFKHEFLLSNIIYLNYNITVILQMGALDCTPSILSINFHAYLCKQKLRSAPSVALLSNVTSLLSRNTFNASS